jgi:hypothetical protein
MEKIKHLQPLKDDNHWTCPKCSSEDSAVTGHFRLGKVRHSYVEMTCKGGCGFAWTILTKSEGWLPGNGKGYIIMDLIS